MNAALRAFAVAAPTAATVLIETTLILLAAILIQPLLKRFPAVRHSALVWALIAVSLCPTIVISARHTRVSMPSPLYDLTAAIAPHHSEATPVISRGGLANLASPRPLTLPAFLISAWIIGASLGVIRLARGWRRVVGIRKAARPASDGRIERARVQITAVFDRAAPAVLASERVGVPLAVGYRYPAVLIPAWLLSSLNDAEILQVLAHECAHVFRGDPLTNLYQRVVAAVLWFHPLIHIVNRLLDTAREDLCDNYVLRVATPVDYSKTLLAVAESVASPDSFLAPTLLRTSRNLEPRVARLLDPERCLMTTSKPITVTAVATLFLCGTLTISAMAVPASLQQDRSSASSLSYVVKLGTPQKTNDQGDAITIESIRGTSDTIRAGNTYEVSGTYTLASADKAELAINVTTGNHARPILVRDQGGRQYELIPLPVNPDHHPPIPAQKEAVSKGSGRFTLRFHMWGSGQPHVSFYPIKGSGESFLSTYF